MISNPVINSLAPDPVFENVHNEQLWRTAAGRRVSSAEPLPETNSWPVTSDSCPLFYTSRLWSYNRQKTELGTAAWLQHRHPLWTTPPAGGPSSVYLASQLLQAAHCVCQQMWEEFLLRQSSCWGLWSGVCGVSSSDPRGSDVWWCTEPRWTLEDTCGTDCPLVLPPVLQVKAQVHWMCPQKKQGSPSLNYRR